MSDSIKVAIKVRPLIKREKDDNLPLQWSVQGNSIAAVDAEMRKRGDGRFEFGTTPMTDLAMHRMQSLQCCSSCCLFHENIFI